MNNDKIKCGDCNGSGVVGSPPDQYRPCECTYSGNPRATEAGTTAKGGIKRYREIAGGLFSTDDGKWVLYTDHLAALAAQPVAEAAAQADGWVAVAVVSGELTSVAFKDEQTARDMCVEGEPFPFYVSPAAAATPSLKDVPPWRVAEFWSSSTPGAKVLMLAKNAHDLSTWGKRSDFLRWVSPDPAALAQREQVAEAAAQADGRWAAQEVKDAAETGLGILASHGFTAPAAQPTLPDDERTYTLDEIADACTDAEVSDGQYEAISIALMSAALRHPPVTNGGDARRQAFAEVGEKLRANVRPDELAKFVDAEILKPRAAALRQPAAPKAQAEPVSGAFLNKRGGVTLTGAPVASMPQQPGFAGYVFAAAQRTAGGDVAGVYLPRVPTDELLHAMGWENFKPGHYVDRGEAERRYAGLLAAASRCAETDVDEAAMWRELMRQHSSEKPGTLAVYHDNGGSLDFEDDPAAAIRAAIDAARAARKGEQA